MPRTPRNNLPDAPLHLIGRGVEKRDIFLDDADRRFFMNCVRDAFDKHGVSLFSHCLMTNHFHLLAMTTGAPIGLAMHLLQTRYAHRFNNRYRRVGHLFQNRFHAVPVLDLRQFVTVSIYVNENPLRAGLVQNTGDWAWSSHREIMGAERGLLDLDAFPGLIGMEWREFVELYTDRVRTHPCRHNSMSIAQLIEEAGALCGLTAEQVRSGGHGAAFTYARKHLVLWSEKAGIPLKELSDELNCSKQALHRLKK